MIQKGTMRPVKKVLGGALLVIGVAHVLNITQVLSMLEPYKQIVGVVIGVAGYFLYISGRQN